MSTRVMLCLQNVEIIPNQKEYLTVRTKKWYISNATIINNQDLHEFDMICIIQIIVYNFVRTYQLIRSKLFSRFINISIRIVFRYLYYDKLNYIRMKLYLNTFSASSRI